MLSFKSFILGENLEGKTLFQLSFHFILAFVKEYLSGLGEDFYKGSRNEFNPSRRLCYKIVAIATATTPDPTIAIESQSVVDWIWTGQPKAPRVTSVAHHNAPVSKKKLDGKSEKVIKAHVF